MVKAFFCGDIEGRIGEVLAKVAKYNSSKLGPFDVLFCVGKFLDEKNEIALTPSMAFPIPTYIVVKDDIISPEQMAQLRAIPNLTIVTDVTYLSVLGLRLLCIPGVYDPQRYLDEGNVSSCYYRKSQIESVLKQADESPVDVVLSGEWTLGMLHFVNPSQYPSIPNCTAVGSSIISDVLKAVKPRYHFAASMNIFYERRPYRNANQHITRIVCLGPVKAGSDKSRKWLHALNLTPCIQMPESELIEADANCTPSPFELAKRPAETQLPPQAMKRPERETPANPPNYRFALQPSARSECWFCLASPNVEKQLIVSVGENAYLALPKGQLTPGHVLVIPVVHRQSTLQLPEEAVKEVEAFKKALIQMFHAQGKAVLLWERNLTTRNPVHCHLQVLPIDREKEAVVKIVLDAAATQRGFRFSEMAQDEELSAFAGSEDYLYAEVWAVNAAQPKRYGYVVKERRPQMQFFHQAVGSLLESENAGSDWKGLQKSAEEEAALTDQFREMFKPYDFTVAKE